MQPQFSFHAASNALLGRVELDDIRRRHYTPSSGECGNAPDLNTSPKSDDDQLRLTNDQQTDTPSPPPHPRDAARWSAAGPVANPKSLESVAPHSDG
jgi:hypothetical protein